MNAHDTETLCGACIIVGSSSILISQVVSASCNVYDTDVSNTGVCTNKSPIVIRIHGALRAMLSNVYVGAVYPANAFNFRQIGCISSRSVAYTVKSKLKSRPNPVY